MTSPGRFLTAAWQHLAMLNFEVDPDALAHHVPAGVEIDFHHGKTYLSVVGFRFLNTKVLGVPVPCHRDFDEVNLRFYVKRIVDGQTRRGVTFIKELVPKRMIAFVANWRYNENYVAVPMRSQIELPEAERGGRVTYEWQFAGRWHSVRAEITGVPRPHTPGSEPEFITEHYWGYTRQRDGGTMEYQVEHPPWRVWSATSARLDCDVAALYGREFAPYLAKAPTSAFVADGSPITVRKGTRLTG